MKRSRKRKAVILFLSAVGLSALIGTAFVVAPNQIAEARPGTCVSQYAGDNAQRIGLLVAIDRIAS